MSNNRKGAPVRRGIISRPLFSPGRQLRSNVHPVSLTPGIGKRDYDRIYISRFDHHGTIRSWPTAELWHLTNPPAGTVSQRAFETGCTSVTCTNTIARMDLAL